MGMGTTWGDCINLYVEPGLFDHNESHRFPDTGRGYVNVYGVRGERGMRSDGHGAINPREL